MNRDTVVETRPAFDYGAAVSEAKRLLGDIERLEERRLRLGQHFKATKKSLGHGKWLPFLKDVGTDERAAQRYMALAGYVEESKSDTVSDLPIPTYAEAGITKTREIRDGDNARWTCPGCDHVWGSYRSDCWNCHEYRSDGTRIPAANVGVGEPDPAVTRPAFHAEAQKRLPPRIDEREDRTAQLRAFWDRVYVEALKLSVHLTDATTSPDDFHAIKNTLISIANHVLEELEKAGVLTAGGQQKQRLLALDGGKRK